MILRSETLTVCSKSNLTIQLPQQIFIAHCLSLEGKGLRSLQRKHRRSVYLYLYKHIHCLINYICSLHALVISSGERPTAGDSLQTRRISSAVMTMHITGREK